ncbi:hypothetical protein T492DRAFT_1112933 [Pavlovales sp. CCMP2436]|nr:hypothetical protein T492DRAFT_1112933 [Pavlovales sp. CCMP2436]
MVAGGATMREVAAEMPAMIIRYPRGIETLRALTIEERTCIMPEVRVFWGPTGTGKTHSAKLWLPDAYTWEPSMGSWFQDYDGEEEVIFNEFRGQLPFGQMLDLLDKRPTKVAKKGGSCKFRGIKIAITSPVDPELWYPNKCADADSLNQLLRRITTITHCNIEYVASAC